MMACLLGLFNTERLASEMSAVTLVMDILQIEKGAFNRCVRKMIGLYDVSIIKIQKLYSV